MTYSPAALAAAIAHRFPGTVLGVVPGPGCSPPPAADPLSSPAFADRRTHIARLEEKYAQFEAQYRRAEETCTLLRAEADPAPISQLMKADAFANRILQQQTRILRELRQARRELEAVELALDALAQDHIPVQIPVQIPKQFQKLSPTQTQLQTSNPGHVRSQERSPAMSPAQAPTEWENESDTPPEHPYGQSLALPAPPLTFAQSVVRQHCRQIDATPPKERAAFVRQLIEEARAA